MSYPRSSRSARVASFGLLALAFGFAGCGGGGSSAVVTPRESVPGTAPRITAMLGGQSSVTVRWTPVEGALSYALYLAEQSGPAPSSYSSLPGGRLVTGLTGLEATIGGFQPGTSVWAVLAARNNIGEGPTSVEASTTLIPPAVVGVRSRPGNERLVVEWQPAVGASAYDVLVASDPSLTQANWAALPGAQRIAGVTSPCEVVGLPNETAAYVIVLASNVSGTSQDSALIVGTPTARGDFTPGSNLAVGVGPQGAASADLDNDGILDLAVADTAGGTVNVLLGLGDGTFVPVGTYGVGAGPVGLIAVDLNADGLVDLVSADHDANTLSVLLADGFGAFFTAQSYATDLGPSSLHAMELREGTGLIDLVVACGDASRLDVFSAFGDGTFELPSWYGLGGNADFLAQGDFDQDGRPDVVTADALDGTVSFLAGQGDGTFGARQTSAAGTMPHHVTVIDLEGDAALDLLVVDGATGALIPLRGAGDGGFVALPALASYAPTAHPVVADFDRDGAQDIAVAGASGSTLNVLLGDGSGGYLSLADLAAGGDYREGCVLSGDYNGDGMLDLVLISHLTGTVEILFGVAP